MYDFKSLSSYDFEILVRDLLQCNIGVQLESFKAGRDAGIDLRFASSKRDSIVVQCKHYAVTGYHGLIRALKNESLKVQRLNPDRYCIATSVPLSPVNKREICELFTPYCRNESDIYGLEDLNNLLSQYPKIERKHFKLWLSSSTVLESVVHSDVYNQTSALVESIQKKTRYYVQNESFFDALKIIKEHNYGIISGIPGIGKTFLAEILLLEYIRQGFEPIVVRSHISEAFKLLKSGIRQAFYYDDFLGQTGWEDKLEKNEEQTILDFISYIRTHDHAVFILTTREYILQQARNVYEKLHAEDFDDAKCIINLNSYTRRNRAHILFNHIYFSKLPIDYRRSLSQEKYLLKIIDHENYSPRIVEWMSQLSNIRDCSFKEYPVLFLTTLNNPAKLWNHAFRNHLTPPARSMLVVLSSFQGSVDQEDLREAFESHRLQEAKEYGIARSTDEFYNALEELEGSFVRCERSEKSLVISFHNPSIRDFLEEHLANNVELVRNLCESIVFYDQFRGVFTPKAIRYQRTPLKIDDSIPKEIIANAAIRTVTRTAKRHDLYFKDGSAQILNLVRTTFEKNAEHVLNMAKDLPENQAQEIAETVIRKLDRRVKDGKVDLTEMPKILQVLNNIAGIDHLILSMVESVSRAFEEVNDYDDLDQLSALEEFINLDLNIKNSLALIEFAKNSLEHNSDILFDSKITEADDEYELERLEEKAAFFEETFGVLLDHIFERIEEKKEELKEDFDPTEDWEEPKISSESDANDKEIVSMFESMFD
jgi:hypothetical protein